MPAMIEFLRKGLLLAAVAGCVLSAVGQAPQGSAPTANGSQGPKLPYTARYTTTTVKPNSDGSKITSQSREVHAVDSVGRTFGAYTSTSENGSETTQVQTSDPLTHTLRYWAVPGTTATVVNAPDVGEDTDCSRKMKAIGPLHPGGVNTPPPIKDLGTSTILGIAVSGGEVSFMPTIFRAGDPPHVRTNQVWTATDPALDGLLVRVISDSGPLGTSTRELVKFDRGEPDPSMFQMPAGRVITTKNGQAYYCGKPQVAAPPASHPAP